MSDESNIEGRDEDHLLVAEYALGVLPDAEHEGVRARLKAEPSLRRDLAFWRNRLASLDEGFAETPAPAGVWPRIEQQLFTGQQKAGFWNSLALWRSLTAAAAAVAVVAVALNVMTPRPDPEMFAAELVAALHEQGTNVSFVALYNPQTGEIRLTALSGDTMPDQDYELWAIEGANPPVSMGVVPIDASMSMPLPEAVRDGFGAGTMLAVTIEQKGGSPTGAPQGPIVAKGMATQI